jgi:Tat protein secretion system quality control protein TatD with DNase activity
MLKAIDIHTHLFENNTASELANNNQLETVYISTAITPNEVKYHIENKVQYWFAGIHPGFTDDKSQMMNILSDLLQDQKIIGVGEVGLDKRYGNIQKQISIFKEQLELANQFNVPILIHDLGYPLQITDLLGKQIESNTMVIMHSYKSSLEIFKKIIPKNIYFSLSHRILDHKKYDLVVEKIIESGRYFFESDYPYCGTLNEIKLLEDIVIDKFRISRADLRKTVQCNFDKLVMR